jgi:gliding motility-associated lipoprotein GldH
MMSYAYRMLRNLLPAVRCWDGRPTGGRPQGPRVRAIAYGIALLLVSCGPPTVYEKTYALEDEQWVYADSLRFNFAIEDTLALYNLFLDIEHGADFGFQNLYTRIHTQFPSGQRASKVLSLELSSKEGRWLGRCGKQHCRLSIPIQPNAYFDQPGPYTITLEQYMRLSPLPGVKSIAFRLEKTGQQR